MDIAFKHDNVTELYDNLVEFCNAHDEDG